MTTSVLYRYEIEYKSEDGDTNVYLREFKVLEETDKTYLIEINSWTHKRIRKTAYNAYAHTQKQKALDHFVRRTSKRISWFEFWKQECEKALELAKDINPEEAEK